MKTNVATTSLMAYNEIRNNLQPKEQVVLNAIKRLQPCSDQDISEYLLWPINSITGRRNALENKHQVIKNVGQKKNRYNRLVNIYCLVDSQLNLFQ